MLNKGIPDVEINLLVTASHMCLWTESPLVHYLVHVMDRHWFNSKPSP